MMEDEIKIIGVSGVKGFVRSELRGNKIHLHSVHLHNLPNSNFNRIASEVTIKTMELEDEAVKSALIKLDWKPQTLK